MMERVRRYLKSGDPSLSMSREAAEADICCQRFKRHRKVARMVLVLQALPKAWMAALKDYLVSRDKGGHEEWESAYVIPVGMADEDFGGSLAGAELALHQMPSELSQSGPRVDDDSAVAINDFQTWRVTTDGGPAEKGQTAQKRLRFFRGRRVFPCCRYQDADEFLLQGSRTDR